MKFYTPICYSLLSRLEKETEVRWNLRQKPTEVDIIDNDFDTYLCFNRHGENELYHIININKDEYRLNTNDFVNYIKSILPKKSIYDLQCGDCYWFIDTMGNIEQDTWTSHSTDRALRDIENCFIEKEDAIRANEKFLKMLKGENF